MLNTNRIEGIILLAGGESSRMGRDKATLDWNGIPLIEHIVRSLRVFETPVSIIAEKESDYSVPGAITLPDRTPGEGPVGGILTGLLAALETTGPGWRIVACCDMPGLKAPLFEWMLTEASEEFDAVVPFVEGRLQPLCGLYHTSAIPELRAFLSTGDRAAKRALRRLRVRELSEEKIRLIDPNLDSFVNLNTPEDLQNLKNRSAVPK